MANAQERGWGSPPLSRSKLKKIAAGRANVAFPGGVHQDIATLFTAFLDRFDTAIERLIPGYCWGYAGRRIRGGSSWSNHAWGLAVDINAPHHLLGKAGTFSPTQVKKIRTLVKPYNLRWGGDYRGRVDEMHFEFMGTPQDARQISNKLTGVKVRAALAQPVSPHLSPTVTYQKRVEIKPGERTLSLGVVGSDVGFVQRLLGLTEDDHFGPKTKQAIEEYQATQDLAIDGIVGPNTWEQILALKKGPPAFPLPAGHWFGFESPDDRNHSGFWHKDRVKIKVLQRRLRSRGYVNVDVNGRFDANLESAVKRYQRKNGLTVDGLVGINTWKDLWS